ncbi:hypothetical protein MMC11_006966 [Xylographa trunciseda]|nr:hypothetical protein [Xylographa trunciseda]
MATMPFFLPKRGSISLRNPLFCINARFNLQSPRSFLSTSSAAGQRLADKVAIVTGSSSGLGRAIALAFAAQGTRLVVCSDLYPIAKGTEFGAEVPGTPTHKLICQRYGKGRAVFRKTDVTKGMEVERLVATTVEQGGRLDVVVNNAGIASLPDHGAVHEMEEETWDRVMKVNSRSVFLGCKYACAQFLRQEQHSSGHRGWIVNTASIMGLVAQPIAGARLIWALAAYCASKGAVVLMTKQIAVEYARHKIHCNAICPGHLRTPMTQSQFENESQKAAITALTPWGDDWGAAEDVAKCAVFLASDDAAYVTGVALPIDGGYTAQ